MIGVFKLLIVIAIGFGVYGVFMPEPEGISVNGEVFPVPFSSIGFYEDVTGFIF